MLTNYDMNFRCLKLNGYFSDKLFHLYGTNNYTGYEGNRLTAISGFTNGSYGYDANGSLISDGPRGFNISYNHLNLPKEITGSQTVSYTYDATGAKLDQNYSKNNTSAGGEKMGETEFWDEFIVPGTGRAEGNIIFSDDPAQSWDALIAWGNQHANNRDLSLTREESKLYGVLDIKNNRDWAFAGPMTGRLLNGKFATARSAGNYLAGMNGVTGTFQGMPISGKAYMKLAGAYQVGKLSVVNAARILMFGTSFGPPPYYEEQSYSGRRILQGINKGLQKR